MRDHLSESYPLQLLLSQHLLLILVDSSWSLIKRTCIIQSLFKGKTTNGSFEWMNCYKFRNPFITSMSVLFKSTQCESIFNNVDINRNDEDVTISPGYYSLSQIIVILNTMNNTTFYKLWMYLISLFYWFH